MLGRPTCGQVVYLPSCSVDDIDHSLLYLSLGFGKLYGLLLAYSCCKLQHSCHSGIVAVVIYMYTMHAWLVVTRLVTGRVRAHSCVRETCVRRLHAAWGETVYRIVLPFARGCRVGV